MRIVSDKEKLTNFVAILPGECFISNGTYYMKITEVGATYDEAVVYNAVAISNNASGELCYFDNQRVVSAVNLEAKVVE